MNAKTQLGLPLFDGMTIQQIAPSEIEGVCEVVLHSDLKTGFTVAKVKTSEGSIVVAGKGDPISPGDFLKAKGAFESNAKFGRQFRAKFLEASIPQTTEGIRKYLANGAIPGVGVKLADTLAKKFEDKLNAALEDINALKSAGISDQKAYLILDHWKMRSRHNRLISFLNSLGAGPSIARKLIEAYGDNVYRTILTTPYKIAQDVHGIGFKTADRFALTQGTALTDPSRIRAALVHVMMESERDGGTAISRLDLMAKTSKEISVPDNLVTREIDFLMTQGDIIEETVGSRPVLFRKFMQECEAEIAEKVIQLAKPIETEENLKEKIIRFALVQGHPPLHEGQVDAIATLLSSRVSILTGSPGTGKTSTVSVLLGMLRAKNLVVQLAAPTGRAAKRLTEQTGSTALTLHRLLEIKVGKGFSRNEENPLECHALVVDEGSMLDTVLFRDVLRALPPNGILIIVGDVDQLPSVGAGQILSDLINSGSVPVARLTHIFRQGAGSEIATGSRTINKGSIPKLGKPGSNSDLWGITGADPKELSSQILNVILNEVAAKGFDIRKDVQVLSPGHQGDVGTTRLNELLQDAVNPKGNQPEIVWKDKTFRLNDRVIQTSNDYDLDVFNGDIGFVTGIDEEGLEIDWDGRVVRHSGGSITSLSLAYCISIHKSQGSEFPAVILAISNQHWIMLRRNLIYTAVSRARKLCCIVSQKKALEASVRQDGAKRLTGLKGRLVRGAVFNIGLDDE